MAKKLKRTKKDIRVTINLTQDQYEKLFRLGRENVSAGVRKLVDEYTGIIPKG